MSGPGLHPTAQVHPTAVIEEGAEIGPDASVGAYAVVGPHVRLLRGAVLKPHAYVTGRTEVGEGAQIFPFAVVGEAPQDLKYAGEPTRLTIGARSVIREHATVHLGTEGGGGLTRVGEDCLIMGGVHIAHDCQIGNGVIAANHVAIAGHVEIGDGVILGGLAGVHQWVRIGRGAMIGGLTKVTRDVIPHGLVDGAPPVLGGLNLVGLRRKGVARQDIHALRAAFDALRGGEGSFQERVRSLDRASGPLVAEVIDFVTAGSDRQFMTPGK